METRLFSRPSRELNQTLAHGLQTAAKQFIAPLTVFVLSALSFAALAQLVVTPIGTGGVTPNSMANSLLSGSSGITINSVTYTGANIASGIFSGGTGIIGIIGFSNGILLTSGSVYNVVGPNDQESATMDNEFPGDPQLDAIVTGDTLDASILQINFTPSGNQVQLSYVFGSEEYNEFVGSEFNDVFAFFVNGVNYALVPGTATPVAINNINCGLSGGDPSGPNCNRYINNPPGSGIRNTQLDGLTQVLSFIAPVNQGVANTMRLTIADRSDRILDSAVFIAAVSFRVDLQSDCLFDWAERTYPNLFAPPGAISHTLAPYYYRYYPQTNAYLATSSADHVYYLGPLSNNSILDAGALSSWLSTAGCQ